MKNRSHQEDGQPGTRTLLDAPTDSTSTAGGAGPRTCERRLTRGLSRRTATPLFREHSITTRDGVRLSIREHGSRRAGHTVVLLHGMCLDKDAWNLQIAQLMRHWGNAIRIVSYDHRGHGASTSAPMDTYRISQLAEDLAEVLAAVAITGPLTLAGHSMGGMTALAYLGLPAGRRPVEPENLILVGSAAGKLTERGVGRLLANRITDVVYEVVRRGPRFATEAIARVVAGPLCAALAKLGGHDDAACDTLVTASTDAISATPLATKVGFLRALKEHDQYATLATITARTTVISGGADTLTPPIHAEELVAGIRDAVHLHHPEAGHMLLEEVPQAVTAAIHDAIAQVGRGWALAA